MSTTLTLISTGGTFDKIYDPLTGALVFGQTHAPEILATGRCRVPVRVQTPMLKDSLEMTDADRAAIVAACTKAKGKHIVITHGTDTMVETARALAHAAQTEKKRDLAGKTLVLTGAMVPHAVTGSDAAFNLGTAVAFAQALPPGVFVAMNGRVFAWDAVVKNRKRGWFEEK